MRAPSALDWKSEAAAQRETEADRGRGEEFELRVARDACPELLQKIGKQAGRHIDAAEPRRAAISVIPCPYRPDRESRSDSLQLPDAGKACPDGIDAQRHELLKESAAIQQAADRETSNDRDSAGECGAQSEPPVVQPDPKQCRDRSGNQAMFIKSSKHHEQNCGLDRAIMRLEVQGPDQSRSHDRQCRQVGIIHPDIIVEERNTVARNQNAATVAASRVPANSRTQAAVHKATIATATKERKRPR